MTNKLAIRMGWLLLSAVFLIPTTLPSAEGKYPTSSSEEPVFRAGTGRTDITPNYPVRLNGFGGRRDEATGTSQHLWAKALAISWQDQSPIVIISIDNLGIREPMVDSVARRLEEKFGLPRENVALTFSHTHCAPKVNGASDTIFSTPIPPEHQRNIDRYSNELPELLFAAASQALENMQPASLEWSVGTVKFAANRRTAGGPVDHDLPVLIVKNTSNELMAIYTSYACHCVTLSFNEYSGDWAGYAQELIERENPGVSGMVSIGCGSDANPQSGVTGDNLAAAAEQGQQIADEIRRILASPSRKINGPVSARLEHIELPLNPIPNQTSLEEMANQGGAAGYNATWQLAKLERGEPLVSELSYPIQSFAFGDDLQMTFLAGEVCVDYALRLKRELNRDRIWVHGYSNDFCAYIPSERLLREGGYGGGGEIPYFALPATLAPGLEEKIIAAVHGQTSKSFQIEPGTNGIPPKLPGDSLNCLRTHEGLSVQLVAAEPLVSDPVAIDFGIDGSLWVAEMPDYGRGVHDSFEGEGHIRRLVDNDYDGVFDASTVLLEGLRFPTDVKVWRDGVLVCDAPEIIFAADRDGDGLADVREVILSGFATHNPHARVNSLRFGLDGWIYGSGGLFGGTLKNRSGEVFDVNNRDFRFNPDTGEVEGATGQTQQGRTRDDFDNWFGCSNSMLLMHYAIDDRYTRFNPRLRPPQLVFDVPSSTHGQRLFPPDNLVLFQLSGPPGRPTSACGAEIYRDRALGEEYYGNAFVCEPVNQVVHRMQLKRDGITFIGERAASETDREFLTSSDQWFRPVQVRTGPDGALYVVDMYRYVIEHSQWIPPESRKELNIFAGQRMGRIYRVTRSSNSSGNEEVHSLGPWPRLDQSSELELVELLNQGNGLLRDMASQSLIWKGSIAPASLARLHEIARQSQSPASAASALTVLSRLGEIDRRDIEPLLMSEFPEARRIGLRFCESHIDDFPRLWMIVGKLATDENDAVRTQAIFLIRKWKTPAATNLIARLLKTSRPDSIESFAALATLNEENAWPVVQLLMTSTELQEYGSNLSEALKSAVALGNSARRLKILALACGLGPDSKMRPGCQTSLLAVADWLEVTSAIDESEIAGNPEVSAMINQLLPAARDFLSDPQSHDNDLIAAIRLMASAIGEKGKSRSFSIATDDLSLLLSGINATRTPRVQSVAAQNIISAGDPEMLAGIFEQWESLTPNLRSSVTSRLLAREDWTRQLLQSIREGGVAIADLDISARQQLLTLENSELRAEAEQLLSTAVETNRASLVEEWHVALSMTGEFERGRRVFAKHCAACHRLDNAGYEIGPDLAALTNRNPSTLLVAILDPNRDIDSRYLAYSALTVDGLTLTGVLAGETAASVTLKEREDKQHTILRKDLEELRATRKSAMPEGLEKDLSHQDAADLFAYLGPTRTPRRVFAGNEPATIRPDADGNLVCQASTAEIFGDGIVFESESPYRNLGYWSGERDLAFWALDSAAGGSFDVYLDFACSPDSAGNTLLVSGQRGETRWEVPSTGAWSDYRWEKVGTLELVTGANRILVGFGKLPRSGALIDLRQLVLVPKGKAWPK